MRKARLKLSSGDALYVLDALVQKGTLSPKSIRQMLRDRDRTIREIRARLTELVSFGQQGGAAQSYEVATDVARPTRRRRVARRAKAKISPKVIALRKKQGKYMGLVRNLKATDKVKVSRLRQAKGLPAAIKLAEHLAA